MSRIGNSIIILPKEVEINQNEAEITVKGPKGDLRLNLGSKITISKKGENLLISRSADDKEIKALHGFIRSQLANMIIGVTKGWSKTLELSGVGFRANLIGDNLNLAIGFSHPIVVEPAKGIAFQIAESKIIINGIDKQLVGQVAANIRALKKPEPYKGKGIKYQGEHIRKKAGKSAKAVGGTAGAK